ncbi:PilT/PilU family type 4a pilus ATPase [Acanthopleuribacter pedis]
MFNKMIANLLVSKNVVPKDLVKAAYRQVTPTKDVAQVLLEYGTINAKQAQQVRQYVQEQMRRKAAAPEQPAAPGPPDNAIPLSAPIPDEVVPSSQPVQAVPVAPQSAPPQSAPPQSAPPQSAPPQSAPPQSAPLPSAAPQSAAPQSAPAKPRPAAPAHGSDESRSLPIEFREGRGDGDPTVPVPEKINRTHGMTQILLYARRRDASDVHLSVGNPITLRLFGRLVAMDREPLGYEDVQRLIYEILSETQREQFETTGDLEMSFSLQGGGRFRATLMRRRNGIDFTARLVPRGIRSFEQLGMPESCKSLTKWATGMVLVTGPLSSGKSTTLTTLVEMVNRDRKDHIITIENPIEFVYTPAKCQVTQRQVDLHTLSQGNALRGALRQDPDIIVVSELRDLESIRLAVTAAETGHLVFGTMNTANATRTVNRLIDSFPPEEQEILRVMVSESLRGIISQQLIPRKDGRGQVAAFEVLMVTQAVSNMIRKNATHQLESAMVSGRQNGMVLLDNSLMELVQKGVIEGVDAFKRASQPKKFLKFAPEELRGRYNG